MLGLGNNLAGGIGRLWSPFSISSLLHWYRFDTGITKDATPDVTKWEDQKGSNDVTSSGVSAFSPLYSNGAVVFNGSGDILTFGSALALEEFSFYIRLESEALTEDTLVEGSTDFIKIQGAGEARTKITNRSDFTYSSPGVDTKFNIGSERDGDGNIMMYINGSAATLSNGEGNEAISDTFDLTTMGQPAVTCKFYEVVICSDVLSTSDRANLNTYLNLI